MHAWLVLHKISKSSLLHLRHGNNVGHSLLSLNQTNTLTHIMSIRSTSLKPKSQLTISLALKRKQKGEEKKKRREKEKGKENSRSKESEESKKGKKIPNQRSEENRRNIQKGLWTWRHLNKYRVITKVNMERKETTT